MQLLSTSLLSSQNTSIDTLQLAIVSYVKNAVFHRRHHYHIDDDSLYDDSNESDSEDICDNHSLESQAHSFSAHEIEWQRPTLVTGNPGTGKSHAILACVSQLLQEDVNIMIATPTGVGKWLSLSNTG